MSLIYKLLNKNPDNREDVIAVTSGLGIAVNVIIALVKVVIGILASSIAVISEGVNNASDALTGIIAFVGSKLAGKHPDEKHPFGYGRIEYLTGLVIAVLILVTGIEMLIGSVKLIFNPEELNISYVTLIIIAVTAVIKFILGTYTIKMGRKAESSALEAVGVEGRTDCIASLITIVSALVFLMFKLNIDAYAGILTSLLIIKAGVESLLGTLGDLIGRPGKHEMAISLYQKILATDGIVGAADMMLHNYGPDAWSGSVNIEIDHKKTVGEIYEFIHKLQLNIYAEYNVVMVFGIYAVDNDHGIIKEVRKNISSFVSNYDGVKSFHAVYMDPDSDLLYCDLVVDYSLRDWDELRNKFTNYMKELYPDRTMELVIETEFV